MSARERGISDVRVSDSRIRMDILTFITRSIEGLAWPVCVLIVTLLFKVQIADLLSRPKREDPGGEFEFSEAAKEQIAVVTEAGIAAAGPSSSGENGTGSASGEQCFLDTAYELLDISPRAAVIEGWRSLYRAALDTLSRYEESPSEAASSSSGYEESSSEGASPSSGHYPTRHPPPARVALCLRDRGILSPAQIAIFDELRQLRNQGVHADDFEMSDKKAKEYLILAEFLIEKLKRHDEMEMC